MRNQLLKEELNSLHDYCLGFDGDTLPYPALT